MDTTNWEENMRCASKSLACIWATIVDHDGMVCTERPWVSIRCPAADHGAIYDIPSSSSKSGFGHPACDGKKIEIGKQLGASS